MLKTLDLREVLLKHIKLQKSCLESLISTGDKLGSACLRILQLYLYGWTAFSLHQIVPFLSRCCVSYVNVMKSSL